MKAVVNRCYGGFSLSDRAIEMLMKRKGLECFRYKQTKYLFKDGANEYTRCNEFENDSSIFLYYQTEDVGEKIDKLPKETYWHYEDIERTDNDLIEVVEELGVDANGRFGGPQNKRNASLARVPTKSYALSLCVSISLSESMPSKVSYFGTIAYTADAITTQVEIIFTALMAIFAVLIAFLTSFFILISP